MAQHKSGAGWLPKYYDNQSIDEFDGEEVYVKVETPLSLTSRSRGDLFIPDH